MEFNNIKLANDKGEETWLSPKELQCLISMIREYAILNTNLVALGLLDSAEGLTLGFKLSKLIHKDEEIKNKAVQSLNEIIQKMEDIQRGGAINNV